MRDYYDAKGVSGSVYRFDRFREGFPLSAMGGNIIYARDAGEGVEIVYAVPTDCISRDAYLRWDEAVAGFGAQHLLTRLNFSRQVRQNEHDDIVAANPPLMIDLAPDVSLPEPKTDD